MAFRLEFSVEAERDFGLIFDHLLRSYFEFGESPENALDRAEEAGFRDPCNRGAHPHRTPAGRTPRRHSARLAASDHRTRDLLVRRRRGAPDGACAGGVLRRAGPRPAYDDQAPRRLKRLVAAVVGTCRAERLKTHAEAIDILDRGGPIPRLEKTHPFGAKFRSRLPATAGRWRAGATISPRRRLPGDDAGAAAWIEAQLLLY